MFQRIPCSHELQNAYLQNRFPFFIRQPFHSCFPEVFLDIVIVFFLGFLHFLVSLTYIFRCDTVILIKIFQKFKKKILKVILYMCRYQATIRSKRNVTDLKPLLKTLQIDKSVIFFFPIGNQQLLSGALFCIILFFLKKKLNASNAL